MCAREACSPASHYYLVTGEQHYELAEIEHRSAKRVDVSGIDELGPHFAGRETGKSREGEPAALADIVRQRDLVIGKIEERARRTEFLSLEQHRNARHQQEISGHRPKLRIPGEVARESGMMSPTIPI